MTGIKIMQEGVQLEVQGVDHINTGVPDCEGFERYTRHDVFLQ